MNRIPLDRQLLPLFSPYLMAPNSESQFPGSRGVWSIIYDPMVLKLLLSHVARASTKTITLTRAESHNDIRGLRASWDMWNTHYHEGR